MCHAAVHLMAGGRGAESFRRDPVVIRFDVHPSEIPQAKPWNAWVLGKWRIQSLDYLLMNDESFAANWEVGKPAREQEEREHRAKFGSRLVGELPVQFFVGTTHTSIHALQPILRLREPEDLQDLTTRGAVQDLFNLCLGYTNKGVPLGQAPLCPQLAFPGRSVKIRPDGDPDEKKVWGWEPRRGRRTTEHPWDSNLHIEIFRRLGRKTNLPPMDLILLFYNLTAEEPCRSIAIGRRVRVPYEHPKPYRLELTCMCVRDRVDSYSMGPTFPASYQLIMGVAQTFIVCARGRFNYGIIVLLTFPACVL
ncbi:hypothetical protein C8T65DRAFT_100390 [Cerioporus squamosus]|nr:hypothetical protein C8T65DRAFT_100390 [Cerioporus squamosus]